MKRRWIYFALALVMMLSCCTFNIRTVASAEDTTSSSGPEVIDNRTKPTPAPDSSDADFEISGYLAVDTLEDTVYIVIVKNNSEAAVKVNCQGTAKDASGNILDVDDGSINVLGPGESSFVILYFTDITDDKDVAAVDTQMTYETSDYKPVLKDISFSEVLNNDNVVVSVTNNGTEDAMSLSGIAIFFDTSNNVIGYNYEYFFDSDGELKSGITLADSFTAPEGYDHVDVYFSAYSDGTPASPVHQISEGYDVNAYFIKTESETIDYLAIKNNTDVACGIYGNAIAKDASGSIVDAADLTIAALGSGETMLGSFEFQTETPIATVEYQLFRNMSSYYQPFVSNLAVEASASAQNITVTVTNNGTAVVWFAQAKLLLFNKDGKIVAKGAINIIDDDGGIKPNATLTGKISVNQAYAYALIFMGGLAVADEDSNSATTDENYTPTIKPEYQEMNTVVAVGDVPATLFASGTSDTSAATNQATGGVTPEFKKTMDSYEEFFNQYAEFMKSYNQNPSDLTLMTQYLTLMSQYVDTMNQLDSLDTDTMSDADLAYYTEVMLRIEQTLVSAAY